MKSFSQLSAPAKTVYVYGPYLLFMGLCALLIPNTLLGILGAPPTTESWIRVLGIFTAVVGTYYFYCAAHEDAAFIRISAVGRMAFFIASVALVLLTDAPWQIALIGGVDLVGASATFAALAKTPR